MTIKEALDKLKPQGSCRLISYCQQSSATNPSALIPLKRVNADISIYGGINKINLQHQYINNSSQTLETNFTFAVDSDTAVSSLTVITQDKEIEAKIMKKEKAAEKYDDSIASGNATYKLQYDKDQQDLLTMKIGNLMPQKTLTVNLVLIQKLQVFDKSWLLSLSPTFTPRYFNKVGVNDDNLPHTSAIPSSQIPYSFNVSVSIHSNGPIQRLVSVHHPVNIQFSDGNRHANVSLKGESAPDSDFNLIIRSNDINEPVVYLQDCDQYKDQIASLVTFFPDFSPPAPVQIKYEDSKDTVDVDQQKLYQNQDDQELLEGSGIFIFVIDRSGSMSGSRIKMATDAAQLFIKSLPQNSHFNVVSFGSGFSSMFSQNSVQYNSSNQKSALTQLQHFQADMGGTQIYQPLDHIYKNSTKADYPVNIFLLTDGGVGNADQIIDLVHKNVKTAKCHTFGIGSGASVHLVKQTAIAGKGTYQFINDGEQNMKAKVIASLSKAVKPALVNFNIKWPSNQEVIVEGNEKVGNVFHGQMFTMCNILQSSLNKGILNISCTETQTNKPKSFEMNLKNAIQLPKGPDLFKICARIAINDMKFREVNRKQEIERISLKYQVLSSETTFLAIQKLQEKASGDIKAITIPISITKDSLKQNESYSQNQSLKSINVFRRPQARRLSSPLQNSLCQEYYEDDDDEDEEEQNFVRKYLKQQACAPPNIYNFIEKSSSKESMQYQSPLNIQDKIEQKNQNFKDLLLLQESNNKTQKQITKENEKSISKLQQFEQIKHSSTTLSQSDLDLIINQQMFEGSWKFNNQIISLANRVGKSIQSVPQNFYSKLIEEDRRRAFATALAIFILNNYFTSTKSEWKRIAIKGIKVLKQLGVDDKEAIEFISKI